MARVCDSCLTAAYDFGSQGRDRQATLCQNFGADLPDHLCDAREGYVSGCACACYAGGKEQNNG